MTEIVESEVFEPCILTGSGERMLEFIEGLPVFQECPICVQSPGELFKHGLYGRMDGDCPGGIGIGPFGRQADEPFVKIHFRPCQVDDFRPSHPHIVSYLYYGLNMEGTNTQQI
jgi:hypothetical protein